MSNGWNLPSNSDAIPPPRETQAGSAGKQPAQGSLGRRCATGVSGPDREVSTRVLVFCSLDIGVMPQKIHGIVGGVDEKRRIGRDVESPMQSLNRVATSIQTNFTFRMDSQGNAMNTKGSVTQWLEAVELGDDLAAQRLWERYYAGLLRLARGKLAGMAGRAFDEEDVVLNAFEACYRGLQTGRFPNINDRHDLWRLLITLTARKAIDGVRREHRQKRGGGAHIFHEVDWHADGQEDDAKGLSEFVGPEPKPEFAVQLAEDLQRRLDRLPEEALRTICLWKMEGFTNDEIAERLDCTTRTVERKLELIRKFWTVGESSSGNASLM